MAKTSQGALENGDGEVLRDSGALAVRAPTASSHQWIPALHIGVINKWRNVGFMIFKDGIVHSPKGIKGDNKFGVVDTSIAKGNCSNISATIDAAMTSCNRGNAAIPDQKRGS